MQNIRIGVPKYLSVQLEQLGYTYSYKQDDVYMYEATQELLDRILLLMEADSDEQ